MRHTHSGVVFLNRVAALAIDVRGNRIDHPATTTSFEIRPLSLHAYVKPTISTRLVREYYLFRGVKGDETSNEGEGDESQAGEGDWELLPVGHLVHVGREVLFGLAVAGELLGFLTLLPEHVEGGRWGGHRRSPGDGGGGGEGADRRHREEGDEEGGKEGGLAHHLLGFSANLILLFSPLI